MECPDCGSKEAWVRGKLRSWQEGNWVHTFVECLRCGSTTRVSLTLDTHDQRVFVGSDASVDRTIG